MLQHVRFIEAALYNNALVRLISSAMKEVGGRRREAERGYNSKRRGKREKR